MNKLTKEELIQLVTKICNIEYNTDDELDAALHQFEQNVPHDNVTKLIFGMDNEDLTPEEIVEKALAHKPFIIELGGPKYTEEELTHKGKK